MLLRLATVVLVASALRRSDQPEEKELVPEDFQDSADLEDLPDPETLETPPVPPREFVRVPKRHRGNASILADSPFRNVLLVVHCRLKSKEWLAEIKVPVSKQKSPFPSPTSKICWKRKELFQPFWDYFPEMVFWTNDDCDVFPDNPHNCLPRLLQKREQEHYDGLFYMHFDALIRPNVMKRSFDPTAIGTFNEHQHCDFATACGWVAWPSFKPSLLKAFQSMENAGDLKAPADRKTVLQGMDDLFYIPKSVFGLYSKLAGHLTKFHVHHEVFGPTLWQLLSRESNVSKVDLGCVGSCCQEVDILEASRSDFRCGHPFRLAEKKNRDLFSQAMVAP